MVTYPANSPPPPSSAAAASAGPSSSKSNSYSNNPTSGSSSGSSGNSSSSSKVQLLFSKSKVYVHPSAAAKDNIPGFLALVRPEGAADKDILLAWIPEPVIRSEDYNSYVKVDIDPDSGTTKSSTLVYVSPPLSSLSSYAFSIPLRNIYSLQIRPPSLGWWWGSVITHTRTEETLPALFFHDSESESTILIRKQQNRDFEPFGNDQSSVLSGATGDLFWGGAQFISVLENFASLERSTLEASIILVNPEPEDRRSFSPKNAKIASQKEDKLSKAFTDAKWSILEKLASITRLSRRAAQNVLERSPPTVRNMLNQPEVQKIGDDFDSARVYLAKWAMGIAEEAEKSRKRIVWNDGYKDILNSSVGGFELLTIDFDVERRNEVGPAEWRAFFDHTGRLSITADEVLERIFHGGVAPSIRSEVWLFLLGVYPWDTDTEERKSILSEKRNEYYRLKRRWWEDSDRQQNDEFWKDQKSRIEKDVQRTDRNISLLEGTDTPHPDPDSRFADVGTNLHLEQMKDMLITYNEFNVNLGYVQGMSDLLSPLYIVFQDDAIAFCAFCNFMVRMERNFLRDQGGMRQQLLTLDQLVQLMLPDLYKHLEKADSTNFFFFFRMLLVWFKREFEWDQILRLWEVLWTDYLSSQFVLFMALALLDKHKEVITNHLTAFDEVLKYMNDLSMKIELEDILVRAEILFKRFKRTVDMIDRRQSESTATPVVPTTSSHSSNSSSSDSAKNKNDKGNDDDETSDSATSNESGLPKISEELRLLLSREVVVVKEVERPPNATGG